MTAETRNYLLQNKYLDKTEQQQNNQGKLNYKLK